MEKMNVHLGSVSHGTLRTEDLLLAFASELDCITGKWNRLSAEARAMAAMPSLPEDAPEVLNALIVALDELAPEGCYFGTLEGDGSDFGFWRIESDE